LVENQYLAILQATRTFFSNMEVAMQKKYIVRLNDQEHQELHTIIKKLIGTSQKVRRVQVLLKADADGPGWTDTLIAEAFGSLAETMKKSEGRAAI